MEAHDSGSEKEMSIIDNYRSLVKTNDSLGLRKAYAKNPIDINDYYETECTLCDCGFINKISVASYLQNESQKGFPNVKFAIDTTYDTFKTLIEIGMLKSTNIDFLFSYFSVCPCGQQFERACEIFDLFDKNAIKEYQDEYGQTILRACLLAHCISTKDAQIDILNKILSCGVKLGTEKLEDCKSDYELLRGRKLGFDSETNTVFLPGA
jgi:hypothetical protein